MEKEIVICLQGKEDELLSKQVSMLCERHHAGVRRISPGEADGLMALASNIVMLISDDADLLEKAKAHGISANSPQKMRESYDKAMEMLKTLGRNPVQ